jgi:hypothetical protein
MGVADLSTYHDYNWLTDRVNANRSRMIVVSSLDILSFCAPPFFLTRLLNLRSPQRLAFLVLSPLFSPFPPAL